MLSTIGFAVAALSTGHKLGLALVGVAFVAFALVSALFVPRRYPNFPGRHVGLYVTICILFFAAMISAVLVYGREPKEAGAAAEKQTTSSPAPAPSTTGGGSTTKKSTGVQGNPAAGKQVFETAGCSGCHTLKAAGSTGTVGPNLDQLKPPYARIVTQVEHGGAIMPPFQGKLTPAQIHDVAAFVFTSTHS
jgi:mono/diheme cytochrome c family protein